MMNSGSYLFARRTRLPLLQACLFSLLVALTRQVAADTARFDDYLSRDDSRMVAYNPSALDPRAELNHEQLSSTDLQADLNSLRPAFNGLVLYAWHPMVTPRLLWLADQLGYEAVLLGIWQPRSAAELDGVIALVRRYQDRMALGIVVGNEGINFGRYEYTDLQFAADYLRAALGDSVPLTTSEPLVGYRDQRVRDFGDFLAPNIHPAIDREDLPPAAAAQWAKDQALSLARDSGKTVLLKETGLPRGGKAIYNPEAQAAFWQAYTDSGLSETAGDGLAVFKVAFEAFDLPWKAAASGLPIEAWWGLLDPQRQTTPAFAVWQQSAAKAGKTD
ncbi:hypothetical protein Q4485_11325 [Granulosicoccaceae sp. 1_MG-2023]|nr:hypothetical protein [Granulosicoccaceae sp. 1_MG-2023]